ncbi:hypothetical protein [Tardiphaga sp. 709]|uniref:hypothetical protein n=1 Tax=Tardiphaga sp. 709 TaxID=3076039 RepID=UPI0028EB7BAA|nr:hypothetical protein [Tardiphaga sp. 709]WNV12317.1 hypothetical protein RSO67_14770 [Tardiphaga sp. 709]
MTRALTLLVLGCLLLTGVAVASILGRDSIPSLSLSYDDSAAQNSVAVSRGPVSNSQGKKDRLPVAGAMMASLDPQQVPSVDGSPLRQAFASDSPIEAPGSTLLAPIVVPQPTAKPVQKTYTLLSDAQISAIKTRLNLTASQESYWPGVEAALRNVARRIHETKQANSSAGAPPIDPDSDEVQQLKSAAMPLLFQLREDQKREVRALARMIGLEKVASAI